MKSVGGVHCIVARVCQSWCFLGSIESLVVWSGGGADGGVAALRGSVGSVGALAAAVDVGVGGQGGRRKRGWLSVT